jgi:hypothetical protein
MNREDKTGKLLSFLKPLFDEAYQNGKECHFSISFKRHQLVEVTRRIQEESNVTGDSKIFIFKTKKIV